MDLPKLLLRLEEDRFMSRHSSDSRTRAEGCISGWISWDGNPMGS